jgi:phosphocarrier protein HPr
MASELLARTVEIVNSRGLHARAAARFVRLAEEFDAAITVEKDGASVSGTSIMGLMMFAAAPGSQITISAFGVDARSALDALVGMVAQGFGED